MSTKLTRGEQYTGQVWLSELNMYYYKARIYSPYLGRFLQTDPIDYADQVNLYAYVGDDPGNRGDSSGLRGEITDCLSCHLRPATPPLVPPVLSAVPSAPRSPATTTTTTQSQDKPERYSVTVQIQGKALTTNGLPTDRTGARTSSKNVQGNESIKGAQVRGALGAAYNRLNSSDRLAAVTAMGKAENQITAAEVAGGVMGDRTLRSVSDGGNANQLRIDIVIHTPNVNIIY